MIYDKSIHSRQISVRKALEIINGMIRNSNLYYNLDYDSREEYIPGADRYWGDYTFVPGYTSVGYYLEVDRDDIEQRPDPLGKLVLRRFKLDKTTVRWSSTTPSTKRALLEAELHVDAAKLAGQIEALLHNKWIYETIRIHREPVEPHLIDKIRWRQKTGEGDPSAFMMHWTNEKLRDTIRDLISMFDEKGIDHNLTVSGNKSELEGRILSAATAQGDHMIVEQHREWRDNMYEEVPYSEWRESKEKA